MQLTESSICFKTRLSELEKLSDLSFENEVYLQENKKIIFISVALHLASL